MSEQPQSSYTGPSPELLDLLLEPANLSQLDISVNLVIDLIMRMLSQEGDVSVQRFANVIKLSANLLDEVLNQLQKEHLVEVRGAGQLGRMSYRYILTDEGRRRAGEAFERSQYVGPAPVPVDRYTEAILMQTGRAKSLTMQQFQEALSHLILPPGFEKQIGPAVNNGTSLFLYGPPGNGKTTIAEAIARLISGTDPIFLPYALTIGGYIINLYDGLVHHPYEGPVPRPKTGPLGLDARWGVFNRPVVMAGGELTMEALDLRYEQVAKFYEAPLQMKANGGMFLIDDFGRQIMRPIELLNRWIVPLETGIDFLRLLSGQTMRIPFRQLIVFSTNLDPLDLADEAFLRRIQIKVLVDGPDERMYFQIFAIMCQSLGIQLDKESFLHLLQRWYRETGRPMQAVHPRDILKIAKAMCEFEGVPVHLTPDRIDAACHIYFVEQKEMTWQRQMTQ
jgi:predicted ATPase with chaperone activity